MSSAAAIAAVSAVLVDLLNNGLADHDVLTAAGGVTVTARAPDRITLPEATSQLNLFLYLVTPNAGWRNVGQPERDSGGARVSNPPLALNLHYLLSAYGASDFHAEILLGYAMQILHDAPVLTRPMIRNSLGPSLLVNGNGNGNGNENLPADLRDLFLSGLADQIEMIKLCPEYLNTDEMSKLWTAIQAPYRPTTGYMASVVLIESDRPTRPALPVQTRTVTAVPFRQPSIERIGSQAAANQPVVFEQPILAGQRLVLQGQRLRGATTEVLIDGVTIPANTLTVTDTQISFPIPAEVQAGIHGAQVAHPLNIGVPPVPHRGQVSNAAPFVLNPAIEAEVDTVADADPPAWDVTLTFTPEVGRRQRVALLLNEFEPPANRPANAYRFEAPSRDLPGAPETTDEIVVRITGVEPATYVVRSQVDGAESPLGRNAQGRYATPQIEVEEL